MNRTKRGYVFMKGKKYFVYDGLNLIGRQKGVTIVIPNINISHQHSVIVIIDNRHYLSDTNSSNGTYLKDLKLCPMILYQLNNGDAIKFGLIDATYFKLENNAVAEPEPVGNAHTQIEDNIFNVPTQCYDIPAPNLKDDIHNKLLEDNYSFKTPPRRLETDSINDLPTQIIVNENVEIIPSKLETISINDLPTQIIVNKNDSDTEDEASFNNIDKEEDTLISNIPMNDLPTQLVTPEKDDSFHVCDTGNGNTDQKITNTDIIDETIVTDANEKEGIIGDQQLHDENSKESVDLVTMQPVSQSHSQLLVQELRRRVRNVIASSEDESSDADSQRQRNETGDVESHNDENSNGSVDLITMQPAATQKFASESSSQLYVQELQRRIRYVISSSDDEHSASDLRSRKTDAKRKSPRSPTKTEDEDDDDETDIEAPTSSSSLVHQKKRSLTKRNKPVVDTDSDEESSTTDAEEELKKISGDVATAQGSPQFCPDKKNEESEGGAHSADRKIDIMLDDSDVIPTTQPGDPHKNMNSNFEASVPLDSSFDLVLTHSPPSPLAAETEADRADKTAEDSEQMAANKKDKSDDQESQRTQLEVSFDEDNIRGPPFELIGDTLRPPNPLANLFEAAATPPNSPSPKKNDSIEDRLSKMFQSQIAEREGPTGDDDLFLVPTQLAIKIGGNEKESKKADAQSEDDIFLQPTQFISNKGKNKEGVFLRPRQKILNALRDVKNDSMSTTTKNFDDVEKEDDENEDIFLRPTQMITNVVDTAGNDNKSAISEITTDKLDQKSKLNQVDNLALENEENEDLFLQPTQMITTVVGKAGNDSRAATPKLATDKLDQTSKLEDEENEDLFLQPTQMITKVVHKAGSDSKSTTHKINADKLDEKSKLKKVNDLALENDENEDPFLQPTQMITNVVDKADNDNKSTAHKITADKLDQDSKLKKVDDLAQENDENEDLFLQPTQMITTVVDKVGNNNKSTAHKINADKFDQKSKLKEVDDLAQEDDENEDLFLQPTQMITTVADKEDNDNRFTTPKITTDQLDKTSKLKDDENKDLFLQPTQMITNVAYKAGNGNKSTITKITVDKLDQKLKLEKVDDLAQKDDENENIFLQPTQMITNVAYEAGNGNKSTITKITVDKLDQKLKLEKVDDFAQKDDENENIFLQPTQMITNVTSETKNDSKSTICKITTDEVGEKSKLRKIDNVAQLVDENEDLFLQPTQMISNVVSEVINDIKSTVCKSTTDESDKKSTAKSDDKVAKEDDESEDLYLQPTQMISNVAGETSNDSNSPVCKTTADKSGQESITKKLDDLAPGNDEKNAEDTLHSFRRSKADVALAVSPGRTRETPTNEVQNTPVKRRQLRSAVESAAKKRKTRNNINTTDEETRPKEEEVKFVGRRSKRKQSSDGGATSNASTVDIVRPSFDAAQGEGIYVIKEISDAAGEYSKEDANSSDEFEQPDKEKSRPSPPQPITSAKRSRASAALAKRQTRQKKFEAQAQESTSSIADASGAEGLSLDEAPSPVKMRKIQETSTKESNTPSVRQRSSRKNIKKVVGDEFEEQVDPATPTTSRGAIARTRQKEQTERTENVEELSATVNADADKKNETSRKSARNTKMKRGKTAIDVEDDEGLLLSSDSGSKMDTKKKSRATKGGKAAEQKRASDEDETKCRGTTVDVIEVRSRRGRVGSVANEEDQSRIKNEKKVSTTPSSSLVPPATPERTKRKLKPKVVFTMLDSPELETIIRSLGGFVVDSADACTVLLTSSVKRSLKLLSAIGQGKPICSPKWLHESKKAHAFLDPWNYILEDDEAEKKWNFSLKESLRRSGERKLLANCTFQIMVNTAQDVLKGSIESCGGKCVSRAPSKDNRVNFFIVASTETRNKYAKFLKEKPAPKIIAAEAIFDGVLRQELHFEDHILD